MGHDHKEIIIITYCNESYSCCTDPNTPITINTIKKMADIYSVADS